MTSRIVHGLDIAAYHAGPEVSKTGLDDLARSPAIYRALRSPEAPPRPSTASQIHGNLAHCAILEPAEFDKRYSVHGCMNRNTKAWHEIAAAAAPGVFPIQQDQYDVAMAQRDSVMSLTNVYGSLSMEEIMAKGRAEPSVYWTDPDTGVSCRCRPDWAHAINKKQAVLIDIKTFGDATPEAFSKQINRMRYHVQDAFYSEGFSIASGLEVVAFIFVAVEDKFPYAAAAYQLGPDSRFEGANECRRLLDIYADCEKHNFWPGYSDKTTVVDLPPYALTPQDIEISYA